MMNWRDMLKEELRTVTVQRRLQIRFDPDKCTGVWQCYAVCPVGCWTPDRGARKVIFHDGHRCIACGACVLQCPEGAIELTVRKHVPHDMSPARSSPIC